MTAMRLDPEVIDMVGKMEMFRAICADIQNKYTIGLKMLQTKPQIDVRKLADEIGLTDKKLFQQLKDEALMFMLESKEYPEILGWETAFTTMKNAQRQE